MSKASIQPWITIRDCFKALAFYQAAFGAVEVYHFEPAEGELVSRLSIEGSEFWISSGAESAEPGNVRFIVIVDNPGSFIQRAIEAGASEIFPVREEYGWLTGKIADPFGYQWELGMN